MTKRRKRGFLLSSLGYRHWINAVSDEMRKLVNGWHGDRLRRAEGVRRRARSMELCITRAKGHVCRCGAPMEKSGRMEGGQPCHARSCPRCGRRRQAVALEWFNGTPIPGSEKTKGGLFNHVSINHQHEGHSWKLLTITTRYDPYDRDDLTIEKLEARVKGLFAALGFLWKLIKDPDSGVWASVEMAEYGHVHLHAVLHCRYLYNGKPGEPDEVLPTLRRGYPEIGKIRDIREIKDPESAAPEVTKYACKTPGAAHPEWFAASADRSVHSPLVVNPDLAARWEIATWGVQLQRRYGVFRGIPAPGKEPENLDRLSEPCPACGLVADWFEAEMSVEKWSLLCHNFSMRPFGKPVARGDPT